MIEWLQQRGNFRESKGCELEKPIWNERYAPSKKAFQYTSPMMCNNSMCIFFMPSKFVYGINFPVSRTTTIDRIALVL